ncbi:rod shape-determining protein [Candidatus Berkelbacteria bacterium]|nr:rod shape-determining protein [Candidatus Berkelbacteria bacterium]
MILKRLGIDLGTRNVLVVIPGRGIVINEPSVVALDAATNKPVAIGEEARQMLGRTPDSIIAAHPLRDGVIANYRITEAMLRHFLNRLSGRIRFIRPEIMIAVPAGVTSTERRAVMDASVGAGAKQAYIIKEPIAAALGAGIPIATPSGHMVIDIGGGTTEVAVIALGDIVASSSVRVGGNKLDQAIASYIRKKYNLVIGETTAEQMKIRIGAAASLKKDLEMEVSGSNTITGLPESIMVSSQDVVIAIREPLAEIIAAVKSVLQKTPPELAADVMDKGIVMTGGSSLLRNLDQLLSKVTGVPCQVADEPLLSVAKGTGIAVENLDSFKRSILWAK